MARLALVAAINSISLSLVLAGPVGLPDSARPGAVRPEAEESADLPPRPPSSDVIDIPAVIDRPFDPEECPCVVVREFRLLDAQDIDDYDIKIAEIIEILQQATEDQPENGYSIGQLQEVANLVSVYYRERNLILAQAVVPVQVVQGGIVDLEVYIGTLGRILVEGNEMYAADVMQSALKHLIGKPINKVEVEAALLRLTDFPGLTVFGVFQPGQLVGTADLVLKVQEEKRFDVAMRVDNHGTGETGRLRYRTTIEWNDVTGADRLTASIQQTYNPKLNVFKTITYDKYLGDSYLFTFGIDRNKFKVGGDFAAQNIHGDTDTTHIGLEKSYIRSRQRNLFGRLGYAYKQSTTTTNSNPTNRDRLSVFNIGMDYDSVDTFTLGDTAGGGINFLTADYYQGVNGFLGAMGDRNDALPKAGSGFAPSRRGGSGNFAAGRFAKIFATYTRLQTLAEKQNLLFRTEWQWSDDLLVPLEQYSAGGPENVRAFGPGQVLWDRAYFISFEWLINAPFIADQPAFQNRTWGELLQFSLFYDIAIGRVNDPLPTVEKTTWDNIKGAGVGLRFNFPGAIESRMFWAWEIGGDDVTNGRSTQFWGDFTYSF